jgi:UPF0755 protein
MKRAMRSFGALLAIVIVISFSIALYAIRSLNAPVAMDDSGMTFTILPGTPFSTVVRELAADDVIAHPNLLRWYARITGKASAVQAGEYRIESGITVRELLDTFLAGNVKLYSFTIVEGWNFRELLAAMAANDAITSTQGDEDVARLLSDIETTYTHPEGLFLPETYRFPRGTRDIDILRQAHRHLLDALADEWDARAPSLPLDNPYEALILASIVEKETARADERARIAGVFIRRLGLGMRLQTDPTVIYGIGSGFNGNLTRIDLRTDTEYNTYTRGGLPPTPIAMPGREAIHAVLHPAQGNELYFVATGIGDGSHRFSDTKEQHDAAVREYLKRQRSNRQAGKSR